MGDQRLVLITWKDILSCSGWEKPEDVECPELLTVGWLVSQDNDTVKIALMHCEKHLFDYRIEPRPDCRIIIE